MSEHDEYNELDVLKKRADAMGVPYHPAIGVEKLKERIQSRLDAVMDRDDAALSKETTTSNSGALTKEQYTKIQTKSKKKAASALVRIRVTCMNPDKKNWPGEYFSAGSAKIGTFKKFVPFKSEHPYHVPKIIYDMMKERKFTVFKEVKGPRGNMIQQGSLVPEFAIAILPDLTTEEIKDLANQQASKA